MNNAFKFPTSNNSATSSYHVNNLLKWKMSFTALLVASPSCLCLSRSSSFSLSWFRMFTTSCVTRAAISSWLWRKRPSDYYEHDSRQSTSPRFTHLQLTFPLLQFSNLVPGLDNLFLGLFLSSFQLGLALCATKANRQITLTTALVLILCTRQKMTGENESPIHGQVYQR